MLISWKDYSRHHEVKRNIDLLIIIDYVCLLFKDIGDYNISIIICKE